MPIGVLFWTLMIFWLLFGLWNSWPNHAVVGGNILLWVVIALLGYHDFGNILK
jgi:hypothetical protein